jgi:hypothetical protein
MNRAEERGNIVNWLQIYTVDAVIVAHIVMPLQPFTFPEMSFVNPQCALMF